MPSRFAAEELTAIIQPARPYPVVDHSKDVNYDICEGNAQLQSTAKSSLNMNSNRVLLASGDWSFKHNRAHGHVLRLHVRRKHEGRRIWPLNR
jgi:hypothetical protein